MQLSRAIFLGTVLAGILGAFACATPSGGGTGERSRPDTLSFELPDVAGKIVKSGDFAGRVVLVDLWATWCAPCEASMPFYTSLYERLSSRGFTILAVSVDEKDEPVARFLERRPLPFPVLRDPKGTVPAKIEVAIETMPTSILLGPDGKILHVHSGFEASDEAAIEQRVEAALAKLDSAPGDAPKAGP